MEKMQPGIYRAKSCRASLETIGKESEWPVLKVTFKPHAFQSGPVFIDGMFPEVDHLYFLGDKFITKGQHAGRSEMEVLRETLAEVYSYSGDLTPEALVGLIGVEVSLNVVLNDKGYPQAKYVNKLGAKSQKTSKKIPSDILAKLNSAFTGKKPDQKEADAKSFFKGL